MIAAVLFLDVFVWEVTELAASASNYKTGHVNALYNLV
jgi:hypothetical protein